MNERILVTGATGYIGGRLVPRLLAAGHAVRCLVRTPRKLESRDWYGDPGVEVVQSGITGDENLVAAMEGCTAAYYLVHSMLVTGRDYAERDRELAAAFAAAARDAGLERIVYLGGLGETGADLSEHLHSRREVEQVLASTGVPVTVLRAAMIVGSGSASFEVLRYLVERLPVMVTPKWVSTPCQPIAVDNVLHYLIACLSVPETTGRVLDIGGSEVMNYREIMDVMAECLGVRPRWILPVPVLTPRLSSWWIHLITPISSDIARPLAEGLRNPVVCRNDEAARLMPQTLLSVREAMTQAIELERARDVETIWSAAGTVPGDAAWAGGKRFEDVRSIDIDASPEQVFETVSKAGGRHGWYAASGLWRLRGWMDRLVGGPGLDRGRRDPERLSFGEAVDFWRVAECTSPRTLRLLAEMKLPGSAMLEFEIEPAEGDRHTRLTQTARFEPRGLLGLAYWYTVAPIHALVFPRMLRAIAREATHGSVGR